VDLFFQGQRGDQQDEYTGKEERRAMGGMGKGMFHN
jgi:hypothetical protein